MKLKTYIKHRKGVSMTNILLETTFYGISLLYILFLTIFVIVMYGLIFIYLIGAYIKIDNAFISKKLIKDISYLNDLLDNLFNNKNYLDSVNTSISTVVNFKSESYNKKDIATVSFDKYNNTITLMSNNVNKTIVLGNNISRSEILYIEKELLKRVPKGR